MKKLTPLFIILLMLGACKKDPVTKPVEFKSTTYQTLGTYDTSGSPSYLLPPDTVTSDMRSFINNNLPSGKDLRNTHPELLTTKAIADITITEPSDVFVTFVSQGAGYPNALAFYTYSTNDPPASADDIKEIVYIFPNAGAFTKLKPGDKVKIGSFNVGTSIGFVLMQGAWDSNTKKLNNNAVHFCSNDVLNPEVDPNLKKHAVLINYPQGNKVLIGFEDMDRTNPGCDHDFNDIITYATVVHK